MKTSINISRIRVAELIYLLIGALVLLVLGGVVAKGQDEAQTVRASSRAHAVVQQPFYKEYRGIRLGMTATEVRTKLGEPGFKSDEQDFYVFSANETAQIVYAAQKVVTISTDYTGGVGAPEYKAVVGNGLLLTRPDGSVFRMVTYDSEHFWVSYNKSNSMVPTVTITIGTLK